MKTLITRLFTLIFIISALSADAQVTYNITSSQTWSNNSANNQIPNPCFDCIINLADGAVLTVEKNVTFSGVNFTGGKLVFESRELMLWGDATKKNRFNRVNMVFNGASKFTANGPLILNNSTLTFNNTSNMLVNHPMDASSSRLFFNSNAYFLGQGEVTLTNSQMIAGDGLLTSKAYINMNGPRLVLQDVTSGISVANSNNYYANWSPYYSVPAGRSISTTNNKLNCGIAGKNQCTSQFVYGPIAATSAGLASHLILPVVISNFNAIITTGKVNLHWSTQQESNSSHFLVERSNDGSNWNTVVSIKAAGNSSSVVNYSASDVAPVNGVAHYRLKMVDQDGKFAYSATRSVRTNSTAAMKVYPNPAVERINITLDPKAGKTTIKLFSQAGQLMIANTVPANSTLTTLSVQGYTNGNYILTVTDETGNTVSTKVLVQRN